jgi:hypothetical protein
MSDNVRRIGSPTPTASSTRRQDGAVVGRNRAASTAKSILSTTSSKTISNLQPTGSKKVNTAPRKYPQIRHGGLSRSLLPLYLRFGCLCHCFSVHSLLPQCLGILQAICAQATHDHSIGIAAAPPQMQLGRLDSAAGSDTAPTCVSAPADSSGVGPGYLI